MRLQALHLQLHRSLHPYPHFLALTFFLFLALTFPIICIKPIDFVIIFHAFARKIDKLTLSKYFSAGYDLDTLPL